MRYCAYFCEENVWQLCQDDDASIPRPRRAVFISNALKQVAMRHQRAGQGGLVYWDYHVVMTTPGLVWDLDTTLPMPCDVDTYVRETFVPWVQPARFRVVDGDEFTRTFASDRSHMQSDGRPFPDWDPIGGGAMNLWRFVDMDAPFVGTVMDLETFRSMR